MKKEHLMEQKVEKVSTDAEESSNPYLITGGKNSSISLPKKWFSILVSWFFIGKFPIAPGSIASLSVYPFYLWLSINYPDDNDLVTRVLWISTLIIFLLGWYSVYCFENSTKTHDNKCIVIDEVIGQLLILAISHTWLYNLSWRALDLLPLTICQISFLSAFLLFRFFDIYKPLLIGVVDSKLHSPISTILDDVLAALAGSAIVYAIYHLVIE